MWQQCWRWVWGVSKGKDPEVERGLSCLRTGSEARPPGAQRVKVRLAQERSGDGGRGQARGVMARNLDFFFFPKCNRRALRDLCVKRSLWLLGRRVDCEWGQGEAEKRKGQEGGWQPVEEHLQLPE